MTIGRGAPSKRKRALRLLFAVLALAITVGLASVLLWPVLLSSRLTRTIHEMASAFNLRAEISSLEIKGFRRVEIEGMILDANSGLHCELQEISASLDIVGYLLGGAPLSSVRVGSMSAEARLEKDILERLSRHLFGSNKSHRGRLTGKTGLKWVAKLPDITIKQMSATVTFGQAHLRIQSEDSAHMHRTSVSTHGEHEIRADLRLSGDLVNDSRVSVRGALSQAGGLSLDVKISPPLALGNSGVVIGSINVQRSDVIVRDLHWNAEGIAVKCEAVKLKTKADIFSFLRKWTSGPVENLEEVDIFSPVITIRASPRIESSVTIDETHGGKKPFKDSLVTAFSNLLGSIAKVNELLKSKTIRSLPTIRVVGATFDFAELEAKERGAFMTKTSFLFEPGEDSAKFEVIIDSPDTKGRANKVKGRIDQGILSLDVDIQSLGLEPYAQVLPRFIVASDTSQLYSTKAKIELKEDEVAMSGEVHLKDTGLFLPLIASVPMKWNEIAISGTAKLAKGQEGKWSFSLENGFLALGDAHFDAIIVMNDVLGIPKIKVSTSLRRMKAQDLFDSLPVEAFEALRGVKASGSFAFSLFLDLDFADLSHMKLDINPDVKDLVILNPGQGVNLQLLNQEFYHRIEVPSGKVIERLVGPSSPSWVSLEHVPKHLIDALLTSEDAQFFTHRGFSLSAMKRSLRINLERGGFYQGASTLSQQLAKNLFLATEKTISRKIQEAFITWQMERFLAKEKILELYLNVVEWGPDLYGLKEASIHYFGKTPEELTPLESAYLVAILPNPSLYHKYFEDKKVPPAFERRVKALLMEMKRRGLLSQDEADFYLQQHIIFAEQTDADVEDYQDE